MITNNSWDEFIESQIKSPYMQQLGEFLLAERRRKVIYPAKENVFNAYKLTPIEEIKVCIIGQDPYIKAGEAHGLAFSTESGKSTPSLRKIAQAVIREMEYDESYKWNNNLTRWAEQGVFLLNTVLTVEANKSNSHANKGWEIFTKNTIFHLSKKGGVVFLLWGAFAKNYAQYIFSEADNTVMIAEHPVAASYQGRDWNNNECFKKTNELLKNKIIW